MTLAQPISTSREVVENTPSTATTVAAPILAVTTKVIWRSTSTETDMDVKSVLAKVEAGDSISRSPEYTTLAMEALLASRNRKVSPKKLAKKLANDSSAAID